MADYRKIYANHYGIILSPEYAIHHIDETVIIMKLRIYYYFQESYTANTTFTKILLIIGIRIQHWTIFTRILTFLMLLISFLNRAWNAFIILKKVLCSALLLDLKRMHNLMSAD